MTKTKIYGFDSNIHELAERFIKNHLIVNQTELIDDVLQSSDCLGGIHFDNIMNYKPHRENANEIYEWWLVSDWLSDHLFSLDEIILCSDVGEYWGRTCSGQSIILDGTIQNIVLKLQREILK